MERFADNFSSKVKRPVTFVIVILLGLGASIATAVADSATSTSPLATSTITTEEASSTALTLPQSDSTVTIVSDQLASSTLGTSTNSIYTLPITPWVTPGYTLLTAQPSTDTTPEANIDCTSAYTADLYDTPSGHLDSESNLAPSIGTQSWAICNDSLGNIYEVKIAPDEYATLGNTGAKMPKKRLTLIQPSANSTQINADISSSSDQISTAVISAPATDATSTPIN